MRNLFLTFALIFSGLTAFANVDASKNTIIIDGETYYTSIEDVAPCDNRGGWCQKQVWVNGYYKSNGTYVSGYWKWVWKCCW